MPEPGDIHARDARTTGFAGAGSVDIKLSIVIDWRPGRPLDRQSAWFRQKRKASAVTFAIPPCPRVRSICLPEVSDHKRIDKHREIHVPAQIDMGRERIAADRVRNRQTIARRINSRRRRNQKQPPAFHHNFRTTRNLRAGPQRLTRRQLEHKRVILRACLRTQLPGHLCTTRQRFDHKISVPCDVRKRHIVTHNHGSFPSARRSRRDTDPQRKRDAAPGIPRDRDRHQRMRRSKRPTPFLKAHRHRHLPARTIIHTQRNRRSHHRATPIRQRLARTVRPQIPSDLRAFAATRLRPLRIIDPKRPLGQRHRPTTTQTLMRGPRDRIDTQPSSARQHRSPRKRHRQQNRRTRRTTTRTTHLRSTLHRTQHSTFTQPRRQPFARRTRRTPQKHRQAAQPQNHNQPPTNTKPAPASATRRSAQHRHPPSSIT